MVRVITVVMLYSATTVTFIIQIANIARMTLIQIALHRISSLDGWWVNEYPRSVAEWILCALHSLLLVVTFLDYTFHLE